MLPKQAITDYQKLYKKVYGIELTFEDATKLANDFIQFFRLIHKPIKRSWVKQYERKKK